MNDLNVLLGLVFVIVVDVGVVIFEIYNCGDVDVDYKDDNSLIIEVDCVVYNLIEVCLWVLILEILVFFEEFGGIVFEECKDWLCFWLVDLFDGIKEFIKCNGEFIVNIVLVEGGVLVLGVVYVLVIVIIYFGGEGLGVFKEVNGECVVICCWEWYVFIVMVVSCCYGVEQVVVLEWLIEGQLGLVEKIFMGLFLKFCLVVEGEVDIYLCLVFICEWDIVVVYVVVNVVGGVVVNMYFEFLVYNKLDVLNLYFLVLG